MVTERERQPGEMASRDSFAPGWVSHASWLSSRVLLMVGWFEWHGQSSVMIVRDGAEPVPVHWRSLTTDTSDDRSRSDLKVAVAVVPAGWSERADIGALTIGNGDPSDSIRPGDLSRALTDLQTLVREGLAWLDADIRAEVIHFLAVTVSAEARDRQAGASLFHIREALRERLPLSVTSAEQGRALFIEMFVRVDERAFYVQGWSWDEHPGPVTLTAVSPEGHRVEILEKAFRHPRSDLAPSFGLQPDEVLELRSGFVCYFELDAPSYLDQGWTFELRDANGGSEAAAPALGRDPLAARTAILSAVDLERLPAEDLRTRHVEPAVTRIQTRLGSRAGIASVIGYGEVPKSPTVSIVVPLYRRLDFLEQQLAQFVHDPEVIASDLIYVLDSPEDEQHLRPLAEQLFRLYRLPFKVAIVNRNAGFAGASNLGASIARGRLLVLLNSDVLPDRPGWLGTLTTFYDSTPSIGALAPKLLFEDDSLQHAGLYFDRAPGGTVWDIESSFNGLHRSFPAANVTRPVPAVTGACLMITASLYRKLGGFRGIYVEGRYEDSDLCLRLAELGLDNWYYPAVELYHLQTMPYPSETQRFEREYNEWLHSYLWRDRISSIATGVASSDPATTES